MKANAIVGFGTKREHNDFYPTLYWATEALFTKEVFSGEVWECAAGNGKMAEIIKKYNPCYESDIETGDDFLLINQRSPNIVTNPPYKYAKEFVVRAKELADAKIAMLLKLVFLEGITRYDFFQDKNFPLKAVYIFSRRIQFSPKGAEAGSPTLASAWFVWDKKYKGKPYIDWIL